MVHVLLHCMSLLSALIVLGCMHVFRRGLSGVCMAHVFIVMFIPVLSFEVL